MNNNTRAPHHWVKDKGKWWKDFIGHEPSQETLEHVLKVEPGIIELLGEVLKDPDQYQRDKKRVRELEKGYTYEV